MSQSSTPRTPRFLRTIRNAKLSPASASRLWNWLGLLLMVAFGVFVVTVLVRIFVILFLRSQLADVGGDLARIGGADEDLTGWMTETFPWILSFLLFGFFIQLIRGLLNPRVDQKKVVGSAILFLILTFFASIAPGALKTVLKVDNEGWSDLVEVDPAERWFNRDGSARIYYADHLDGERRFWSGPGKTPFDSAEALPVTKEVAREWMEARVRELEAKRREEAEEASRKEAAAKADLVKQEHQLNIARLEKELEELERIAGDRAAEIAAAEIAAAEIAAAAEAKIPVYVPQTVAQSSAPVTSIPAAPAPVTRIAEHRFEVIPARVLELGLQGRRAEIWTDGVIEFTESGSAAVVVLGSHSPRALSRVDSIRVRPVGKRTATLYLRWIDILADRGMPHVSYSGHEMPLIPAALVGSTPVPIAVPPASPPVQRFGLPVGQVFRLELGGDTIEVWSDGPFHLAAGAGSSVREVRAGQRMKVSGAEFIVASASAPETSVLHVQLIAPSSRRVTADVVARANAPR